MKQYQDQHNKSSDARVIIIILKSGSAGMTRRGILMATRGPSMASLSSMASLGHWWVTTQGHLLLQGCCFRRWQPLMATKDLRATDSVIVDSTGVGFWSVFLSSLSYGLFLNSHKLGRDTWMTWIWIKWSRLCFRLLIWLRSFLGG